MQRYVCIFSKLLSNKRVDFALLSRNEFHIEDTSSKMDHVFRTFCHTVETLYSTIYYSKYFIELNFDKSTQYVAF